jgi:peptide/nickel transport system substrate-binding protein
MPARPRLRSTRRGLVVLAAAGLAAGTLAACGGGQSGGGGGGAGAGAPEGKTLIFGTSNDPVTLDGAYVSDGESIRPIRQIFEGLVTTEAGGTEVVPALAERWETSPDGKAWTFTLRRGVTFHDGEPFNAAAVCANFDRWYNFKGVQQSDSVATYWRSVFGGFAKNEDTETPPSLYRSCEAKDDATAVITLTAANGPFINALTLPAFSIASPKALRDFGADQVEGDASSPRFTGTFGDQHPVGTGPFKLEKWERNNQLSLVRNEEYWGEKAKLARLILKPVAKGAAGRQALEAGDIDGYDLVPPADAAALKSGGNFEVLERPAFNLAYIGFNQKQKPVDNLKIRQAIAHAINREQIIKANYPEGAQVAQQFQPPALWGGAPNPPTYDYNPARAKQLIAESGVSDLALEFYYPTDVTRPYMPDPVANFEIMKSNLEAVGFKVTPRAAKWDPDYLNAIDSGKNGDLHIIGWTGDYGDPDNWSGQFFGRVKPQFNFTDAATLAQLKKAKELTDQAQRETIYQKVNADLVRLLPAIPYAHTKPNVAFKKGVTGYVPSPVNNEDFATVAAP